MAARSRDVPLRIRESLLSTLHALLAGPEMAKIIASRSLGSVQVLLLLSMCDDLNGPDAAVTTETVWQNIGTAIRTAIGIVSRDEYRADGIGTSPERVA